MTGLGPLALLLLACVAAAGGPRSTPLRAPLIDALRTPALELGPGSAFGMPLSAPAAALSESDLAKVRAFARTAPVTAPASEPGLIRDPRSLLEAAARALRDVEPERAGALDEGEKAAVAARLFDGLAATRKSAVEELAEARRFGLDDQAFRAVAAAARLGPEEAAAHAERALAHWPLRDDGLWRNDLSRVLASASGRHPLVRARVLAVIGPRLGLRPSVAQDWLSLADRLPNLDEDKAELAALGLALSVAEDPVGRKAVWQRLGAAFMGAPAPGDESLRSLPARASRGELEELRRRLPTLHALISDGGRMKRFLALLTTLRLIYPYYLPNVSENAPAAWSKAHALVFPYRELRIMPASESFRRFVIEDPAGDYAVELKGPGQVPGRDDLSPAHFEAARDLHATAPGSVVPPVVLLNYEGEARIYGRSKSYSAEMPLRVVLFRYEDGKRLTNAGPLLSVVARRVGASAGALRARALAAAAAASVRLHRLGWQGTHSSWGNDMHPENIRIKPDGSATLVADFGTFHRPDGGVAPEERARDTTWLTAQWEVVREPAAFMMGDFIPLTTLRALKLLPMVEARLLRGVAGPLARRAVREEVRRELGLRP